MVEYDSIDCEGLIIPYMVVGLFFWTPFPFCFHGGRGKGTWEKDGERNDITSQRIRDAQELHCEARRRERRVVTQKARGKLLLGSNNIQNKLTWLLTLTNIIKQSPTLRIEYLLSID